MLGVRGLGDGVEIKTNSKKNHKKHKKIYAKLNWEHKKLLNK